MIRGSRWRTIVLLCALGASLFIPPVGRMAGKVIFTILHPLLFYGMEARDTVTTMGEYIRSFRSLINENTELSRENLILKEQLVGYADARSENDALKKGLLFAESAKRSLIGTRVIGYSFDPAGMTALIDGGEINGIKKSAPVVTGERILVGRVTDEKGRISLVSAVRNAGTTFGSFILPRDAGTGGENRKQVEGLFIGRGNGMAVDLVPNSADVRVGDLVMTNDFSERGAPGLILGEVVSVKKSDTKLFQDIAVRELIPFQYLRTVFVIGMD